MATRILVVDDEPAIGKLVTYQLTAYGYQVSYIQDGLLALHKVLAERPDLVLLDVMMPLISGWELCRQIRASSSIPIIMLTGKSADPDIVTGLHAGADDYVTKPFSMVQLQARIEAVLRRKPPTSGRNMTLHAPARDTIRPMMREVEQRVTVAGAAPAAAAAAPPAAPPSEMPVMSRIGPYVRDLRQSRGISLLQAERACNVRWEFLQAIEQENWDYIPTTEQRRAIHFYGEYLGVNLFALAGRQKKRLPTRAFSPRQFAAVLGVLVVLAVMSMYLILSLHYLRF
jgi:CheY-like chemotaxis protein